jgi:uncharacterized protein YceK
MTPYLIVAGCLNTVTGGSGPVNFSTCTRQLWALQPWARVDVPISLVTDVILLAVPETVEVG